MLCLRGRRTGRLYKGYWVYIVEPYNQCQSGQRPVACTGEEQVELCLGDFFGRRQDLKIPGNQSANVSAVIKQRYGMVGMVWYGMVWYGILYGIAYYGMVWLRLR